MGPDKVVEKAKNWLTLGKKTFKKQELERIRAVFDRFYRGNKGYVDKETSDNMGELMVDTVTFLTGEIYRLEKKRRKLPVENLQLKEAQKAHEMSLRLIREFLREVEEPS
jgi:hypothetical protein